MEGHTQKSRVALAVTAAIIISSLLLRSLWTCRDSDDETFVTPASQRAACMKPATRAGPGRPPISAYFHCISFAHLTNTIYIFAYFKHIFTYNCIFFAYLCIFLPDPFQLAWLLFNIY